MTPAGLLIGDLKDNDFNFIALSYVWGGTKTEALSNDNTAFVEITDSLHLALSDLSEMIEGPTLVWVDALSINQDDTVERNSQVAMMHKIYSAASHVVVHVGAPSDDSASIPELLKALFIAHEAYKKSTTSSESHSRNGVKPDIPTLGLPELHSDKWRNLQTFFSRPWFHRSWTLQEIHAAKESTLICNGWITGVPLWLFSQALVAIKTFEVPIYVDPAVDARLSKFIEVPPLLYVLYANRTDACSDPRDSVYAYLGLSEEINAPELLADYHQDANSVFHKYAQHFVRCNQGVEMLYNCFSYENDFSLPSWVPRWNSLAWQRAPRRPRFLRQEGQPAPEMRVAEDSNILIAKGAIIDRIELVGAVRVPMPPQSVHVTNLQAQIALYMAELDNMISQHTSMLPYEDVALAKWHNLAAESTDSDIVEQALADPGFLHFYGDFIPHIHVRDGMHHFPEDRMAPFQDRFEKLFPMSVQFSAEIITQCASRRSCVTTRGYFGNIDPTSQPGDAIALIQGALHPFIMRPMPREDGLQTHRFVGHGYLVGLEEGAAWLWEDTFATDLYIV